MVARRTIDVSFKATPRTGRWWREAIDDTGLLLSDSDAHDSNSAWALPPASRGNMAEAMESSVFG
jgi:hypothetical protein